MAACARHASRLLLVPGKSPGDQNQLCKRTLIVIAKRSCFTGESYVSEAEIASLCYSSCPCPQFEELLTDISRLIEHIQSRHMSPSCGSGRSFAWCRWHHGWCLAGTVLWDSLQGIFRVLSVSSDRSIKVQNRTIDFTKSANFPM